MTISDKRGASCTLSLRAVCGAMSVILHSLKPNTALRRPSFTKETAADAEVLAE